MIKQKKITIIIIAIVIGIALIFGIIMVSKKEKSPSQNQNNNISTTNKKPIETIENPYFKEKTKYVLTRSYSGTEAYIYLYKNYVCSIDFSNFNGGGRVSKDLSVSVEYPDGAILGGCEYTIDKDIVTVKYNGVVRKVVNAAGFTTEDSFRRIMDDIQFKYDKEKNQLDMNPINGKWVDEGLGIGLDYVYFMNNENKEYIKEEKAKEKEQQEKERVEKEEEESRRKTTKERIDSLRFYINNREEDLKDHNETVQISVSLYEHENYSITINGEKIEGTAKTYKANPGVNTYQITVTGDYNISRTETLTYAFEPTVPHMTIDFWESSCYMKIWNSFDHYNDLDKIEMYYDNENVDSSSAIRKLDRIDYYILLYSTGGTHTLKTVNKYGLEEERTYTFPEKCNDMQLP